MLNDFVKKYSVFLRFLIVGGSSTFIDFCFYMIFSIFFPVYISKIVSMTISSIYSFFINRKWTFHSNNKSLLTKLKYIITIIINIIVNSLVNQFVFMLTFSKLLSFIFATGVAMIVNYILQKFLVFKEVKK